MLFTLGKGGKPEVSFGVILDVGSGSVGIAIVSSSPLEKFPEIIWSYREYISDKSSDADVENLIGIAISNTFLELGRQGLKALQAKYPGKSPAIIQVSLNAPFANTVSRNVTTKSENSLRVNSKLLTSLEDKAKEEARKQVYSALTVKTMNLAIISEVITSVKVDGYPVRLPYEGEGKSISLTQLVGLTSVDILDQIEAARDKVLPRAEIDFDSFMSLYSRALLDITSFKNDVCLLSITARASEVLIISEGTPYISSSLNKGHHSLAREISSISGLDIAEGLGMMKENDVDHTRLLSETKVESIKSVISSYEDQMTTFFRSIGDALLIPKHIYVQVDRSYEKFFTDSLSRSFSKATGLKHVVHPFTSEFFNFNNTEDSRILCPAYVFHKKLFRDQLAEERYLL